MSSVESAAARPALGSWLDRLEDLRPWQIHLIAVLAGCVATLAHAPFHIYPAMAVGLVGLVWLLDGAKGRPWIAFGRAWSWAFGYFVTGLYWVGFAFLQVEGAAPFLPLAVAILPAAMALFWGVAGAVASLIWTKDARRVAVFALMFSLAELARGTQFTGFPWHLPGSIWVAGEPISQLSSIVGIYGLTILTLLVFALPATLKGAGDSFGLRVAPTILGALALGIAWGWGAQRAPALDKQEFVGPVIRVADAGFSQAEKWAEGNAWPVFERYVSLIGSTEESRAAVNIWPEGAIPAPVLDVAAMRVALGEALGDRVLVLGTMRFEETAEGRKAFNSAAVLDGVSGRLRLGQIYDKHHLVPFGEYIPFWNLVSTMPIAPLQQIGQGYTPGDRPERMVIPGAPPATILICYEAIFTGMTPRGEERPDWIINISIDSWYGKQTGPWQHYNQARYRAIEEGLPLARAASGGVSALIDPYGRALVDTGLDGGAVEAPLPAKLPPTLYALYGFWIVVALFALLVLIRLIPMREEKG